jgi:hypothetical protein
MPLPVMSKAEPEICQLVAYDLTKSVVKSS